MLHEPCVYLSSIATVGGHPDTCDGASDVGGVVPGSPQGSPASFLRSDDDVVAMIVNAATLLMRQVDLQLHPVDSFMIVTESFWDTGTPNDDAMRWHPHDRIRQRLMRAFHDLGLEDAVPYANWLSSCANLGPSVALCAGLIHTNQHDSVLLVAADRHADGRARLTNEGINSDAAAACVVTRKPAQFRIVDVVCEGHLWLTKSQDTGNYWDAFKTMNAKIKAFDSKVARRVGRRVRDLTYLVVANVHHSLAEVFRLALGVPRDRYLAPSKRLGHMFAIDTLWSLQALMMEGKLTAGDTIGLLNIGPCAWNIVVVEKSPGG